MLVALLMLRYLHVHHLRLFLLQQQLFLLLKLLPLSTRNLMPVPDACIMRPLVIQRRELDVAQQTQQLLSVLL